MSFKEFLTTFILPILIAVVVAIVNEMFSRKKSSLQSLKDECSKLCDQFLYFHDAEDLYCEKLSDLRTKYNEEHNTKKAVKNEIRNRMTADGKYISYKPNEVRRIKEKLSKY